MKSIEDETLYYQTTGGRNTCTRLYCGKSRERSGVIADSTLTFFRNEFALDGRTGKTDWHLCMKNKIMRPGSAVFGKYQGAIWEVGKLVGSFTAARNSKENVIACSLSSGDSVCLMAQNGRRGQFCHLLSSEHYGALAQLKSREPVTVAEMWKSKFGFGKVECGQWLLEDKTRANQLTLTATIALIHLWLSVGTQIFIDDEVE